MQSQPPHGRTAIGQPVCAHYVGPALGAHTAEDVHPRALRGGVGAFVICARRQGGNEHPAKRVLDRIVIGRETISAQALPRCAMTRCGAALRASSQGRVCHRGPA